MTTVLEALKGISGYPIPQRTFDAIAIERGLTLDVPADYELLHSDNYRLAKADVLMWLSEAPNVSQGSINYSFSDDQRLRLRNQASRIYTEIADNNQPQTVYGYKGSRL